MKSLSIVCLAVILYLFFIGCEENDQNPPDLSLVGFTDGFTPTVQGIVTITAEANDNTGISKIEFILISFDYIYDTPSVMKSIYDSYIISYPNMTFYSSFGHLNDIFMLAGQSFVSFWGVDENDIGHSLRSVIIDPERRLMRVYDGTEWRPEAAERDIRSLLKAYH